MQAYPTAVEWDANIEIVFDEFQKLKVITV